MAKKEPKAVKPAEKQKVFVGVRGEPDSVIESVRGKVKFATGVDPAKPEKEKMLRPGLVINNQIHNLTLSYNGIAMVVPPRGRVKIADIQKLGGLPKGAQLIPLK
jgi:hypothetical protein